MMSKCNQHLFLELTEGTRNILSIQRQLQWPAAAEFCKINAEGLELLEILPRVESHISHRSPMVPNPLLLIDPFAILVTKP